MTDAPTATKVLDGFLAARAASSSDASVRRRAVIGLFRTYVEARGAAPVDELTAYRLTHDLGLEPSEHDLAAVLGVIEHVTGFFQSLSADCPDGPSAECADAADAVRELADWLVQRDLVDADVAEHLGRYTRLYDGDQATGT